MATILVVEDDVALGGQIVSHLEGAGHQVQWLKDGDAARGVDLSEVHLVVLDLMLPGTYGLDLLKLYRRQGDVPVLILSARESADDKVRALKLGADDYLTKPFWPEELLARVGARLRRPDLRGDGGATVVGNIVIEVAARQVFLREHGQRSEIVLTKVELDLLLALARRAGSAMSRRALVDAALDPEKLGHERTLDVHISRLRKKLGSASGQLQTVWGVGYKLAAAAKS